VPNAKRTERFVAALTGAANFDTSDPQAFIRLQNAIVDPRYAATGWRTVQSFIGETMSDFREHVYYVCPKPDDLADLNAVLLSSGSNHGIHAFSLLTVETPGL